MVRSYKKWVKPTQFDLDQVLVIICHKYDLIDFSCSSSKLAKADLIKFLSIKLDLSDDTVRSFCNDSSKLKLPVWILLNALSGKQIADFLESPVQPVSDFNKDELRKMIDKSCFNSIGNGYSVPEYLYDHLFFSKRNPDDLTFISNLTRKDFSDFLSINYTVFSRNIEAKSIRYIHFKIFLLLLGFNITEIGF
ncbi:hypothetical protein ACCE85_003691 [Photobacterium damselae]